MVARRKYWLTLALAALLVAGPFARSARADIVDTFSFTQHYQYVIVPTGVLLGPATLYGTFTGTLDANGFITKSSLTAFSGRIETPVALPFLPPPIDLDMFAGSGSIFSFYAAGANIDSGSLNVFGQVEQLVPGGLPNIGNLCIGASAAFGLCGIRADRGAMLQAGYFVSNEAPVITLESSVVTGVPETSTWAMMVIGFLALGFLASSRRKQQAFAADGLGEPSRLSGVRALDPAAAA